MFYIKQYIQRNQTCLIKVFTQLYPTLPISESIFYFKAEDVKSRIFTDAELAFRQESNFYYLTACMEPGFVFCLDPTSKETFMFIPNYDKDHSMWSGTPITCSEVVEKYSVSKCQTMDTLPNFLEKYRTVHILDDNQILGHTGIEIDATKLMYAIQEARIVKSDIEIGLMQKACEISSKAHLSLMKFIKATDPNKHSERYYSSYFAFQCAKEGGFNQAYISIVGAGVRAAILHSKPSNDLLKCEKDEFVLVDAGCEYLGYASDITRTYPFSGHFTKEHREIYQIVLNANKAVIESLKVGVNWEEMHRLAASIILKGILGLGIVQGDLAMLEKHHVAGIFFPHGLGHLLGLDVHDSPLASYPKGVERIPEPGLCYLRMRRRLIPGMVLTVEPGLYFIDAILDQALADPVLKQFINLDMLEKYRRVGGVRIEDNILIKSDGITVLSDGIVKEISDIEAAMSQPQ